MAEAAATAPSAAADDGAQKLMELLGETLLSKDEDGGFKSIKSTVLEGKTVGVYFSANWCAPCRSFTPKFIETYEKLRAESKDFEVVYVSLDRSLAQFQGYYGEMPWLAVPYADEKRREALNKAFRVMGVPSLFIVGPDGRLITAHGRVAVSQDPEGKNFPWEGVTATNEAMSILRNSPIIILLVLYLLWRLVQWGLGL